MVELWESKVLPGTLDEVKQVVKLHKLATGTANHLNSIFNSNGIPLLQPELASDLSEILKQEHKIAGREDVVAKHLTRQPRDAPPAYFYAVVHGGNAARKGLRGIDVFNQFETSARPVDVSLEQVDAAYRALISRGVYPFNNAVFHHVRTGNVVRTFLGTSEFNAMYTRYSKAAPWVWLHDRESKFGDDLGRTINRLAMASDEINHPAKERKNLLGCFKIKVKPAEYFIPPVLKAKINELKEEINKVKKPSASGAFMVAGDYHTDPYAPGVLANYHYRDGLFNEDLVGNSDLADHEFLEKLHEFYTDKLPEAGKDSFAIGSKQKDWTEKCTTYLNRHNDDFRKLNFDGLNLNKLANNDARVLWGYLTDIYREILDEKGNAYRQSVLQNKMEDGKNKLSEAITRRDQTKVDRLTKYLREIKERLVFVQSIRKKEVVKLAQEKLDELTFQTPEVKKGLSTVRKILSKVKTHANSAEETWTVDFRPSYLDRAAGFISQDCIERRSDFFDAPGMHNGRVYNTKKEWVGNVYVVEATAKKHNKARVILGEPDFVLPRKTSDYLKCLHIDGIQVPQKLDMVHFTRELVEKLGVQALRKKLDVKYITGNSTETINGAVPYVSNHYTVQQGYKRNFMRQMEFVRVNWPEGVARNGVYSVDYESKHILLKSL